MTPTARPWRPPSQVVRGCAAAALAGLLSMSAMAAAESGPAWATLNAAQREALAPLERDWRQIDAQRKQKWLEVAARFPRMGAEERQRIQERMADWARLTPAERARARLQFQEARAISPDERAARWDAYRALPDEERSRWTATAQDAKTATRPAAAGSAPRTSAKDNVVPRPRSSASTARVVTAAVVQARPGATTTPVTTRPAPPAHQQVGLPKIAATPEFVDPATLLPRRGAQAAATLKPSQPAASAAADRAP
jgi:hypothetical protein